MRMNWITEQNLAAGDLVVVDNRTGMLRKATPADGTSFMLPADTTCERGVVRYTPLQGIDYRDLLRRYIRHVSECEGISFIEFLNHRDRSTACFTGDEVKELRKLER